MRHSSTRLPLPQLNHSSYRHQEPKEAGSGPCLQCHNRHTFLFRSGKIFEWNFVIVFLSCSGAFWTVCVFLQRAAPYLRQKVKNQWSDALKSAFSGLHSFTNCIIWVLNHHRLTTLPSLRMVLNSSYKSFSKEGKKGWWPWPLDLLRSFWFLIFCFALTHMRTSFLSICRHIYFFPLLKNQLTKFNLNSRL